jgi:hypothetical protein
VTLATRAWRLARRRARTDAAEVDDFVGLQCYVTVSIPGGVSPGEVQVTSRGMTHRLVAYAEEPTPRGAEAWVVAYRGANSVDVRTT